MSKRALSVISIVVLIALTGCNKAEKLSRDTEEEIIFSDSSSIESIDNEESKDESESVDSEETEVIKEKLVSDLTEDEYNQFPINYLEKLSKYKTYKAVTAGSTITNIIFTDITQKIDVTAIKSEYSYQYNASSSDMYSSEHVAYYHGDKAIYKNKGDSEYTSSTMNEYLDKYGTYPFNTTIEGYKVTGDAITSITKETSEKDGEYVFKLCFDPEKATNNVRIQMREFGQLDDNPVFSDITIILTVKDNYTPIKLDLESHYKAKKIMDTTCHQQYTVAFSNFDEEIEIPDLESIKPLF